MNLARRRSRCARAARLARRLVVFVALPAWLATLGVSQAAEPPAHSRTVLTVYAAGTLAVPFQRIDAAFEKLHPEVDVRSQFAGSVMMARRISDLHQHADVFASADYAVIPKVLGDAGLASWFVGFASNAVTLAYTPHSRGASQISANNWYRVVAQPGVVIGRSDPNTDPSGYQFLQMLSLAENYYQQPDLKRSVLKNSPRTAVRDTETSLISALQLGEIDYLAIYTSSAKSHHLEYLQLPTQIDLGDPTKDRVYAHGTAQTQKGVLHGKPIIYAMTVPTSADHPQLALEYIRFVIGPQGRQILAESGFVALDPALLDHPSAAPAALRAGTGRWPADLATDQ